MAIILISIMKSAVFFIIDKDPVIRGLIKYNLKSGNLNNVSDFPSDEECMYRLKKRAAPDYLIAGTSAGNRDYEEFLRTIRILSPATKVILFDLFDDPLEATGLLNSGAYDVVMKTREPKAGIRELMKNIQYILREKCFADVL